MIMESGLLPLALLLCAALVVGLLIGSVGIGGILLTPALTALTGMSIHEAMATALFTFLFTGITGTWAFQKRGSIDWRITAPVVCGAALFGYVGAWMNAFMKASALAVVLAALMIFAGVYTFIRVRGLRTASLDGRPRAQTALLGGIGAFAGFGSGLTGVGGPAISVPVMVLFGFPLLATIGTSQVIQIVAAISGTVGNLRYGTIDFRIAAIITVVEVAGALLGARLVHAVNIDLVKRFVAGLCIAVGALLVARAIGIVG